MADDTISAMLDNHAAGSWDEMVEDAAAYDDNTKPALTRVEAYVDHCFEAYDVVSNNLDRDQIQVCTADWDRRRGEAYYRAQFTKQEFGKRVTKSQHKRHAPYGYAVFIAKALVGVPPEDDKGVGWKPCVRHELGHCIDYEKRGTSGHGPKFKAVMRKFGHDANDGQHAHGWAPRVHK